MSKIKLFFDRLRCNHDYEYKYQHMINGGMSKVFIYRCTKCGKTKIETL